MDSDPRLDRLEQELNGVKQLNTSLEQKLDDILSRLNITGTANIPHPPAPSPTPPHFEMDPTPTGHSPLKPSTPNDFDGDREKGRSFLNQCHLYFRLCPSHFPNDQIRIQWTLSFLKSGRAAIFANMVIRYETEKQMYRFVDWSAFEAEFSLHFLPLHEGAAARNTLEGTGYYQGKRALEDYIDEFQTLLAASGYSDGLNVVLKFRRGLDVTIMDQIATMPIGRPADDCLQDWMNAARVIAQNRSANQAFHTATRGGTSSQPRASTHPFAPKPLSRFTQPPAPQVHPFWQNRPSPQVASNTPVPMEVDATRHKKSVPLTCYRCGALGHLANNCPKRFDVRVLADSLSPEEQEEFLQEILARKDAVQTSEVLESEVELEEKLEQDFATRNE